VKKSKRHTFKKGDLVIAIAGPWEGKTTTLTDAENSKGYCCGFYCGQFMFLKPEHLKLYTP
jgi:hypothetical protein